jgi:hypothetical protein
VGGGFSLQSLGWHKLRLVSKRSSSHKLTISGLRGKSLVQLFCFRR